MYRRVWEQSQESSQNSGTVPKLSHNPLTNRGLWAHVCASLHASIEIKRNFEAVSQERPLQERLQQLQKPLTLNESTICYSVV